MATTLLTVKEVADRLRLSRSAAYRLIRLQIPSLKLGRGKRGGRVFVRECDLEAWITDNIKTPVLTNKETTCTHRSKPAGGRRKASGTRASSTRSVGSASSDPQAAAIESWLRRG